MRRIALLAALVAALVLSAGAASAAPAQPVTTTEHHATEVIHDEVPCVGVGEITLTYNEVDHANETANGFHFTFTQTGTFSAVLDDGGTSSGRFTIWGGGNSDPTGERANGTFTFSGTVRSGVGAGTSWNSVSHFTGPVDPATGEPIFDLAKVAFDRLNCH
jgi:opacity protein-like surface antigen